MNPKNGKKQAQAMKKETQSAQKQRRADICHSAIDRERERMERKRARKGMATSTTEKHVQYIQSAMQ